LKTPIHVICNKETDIALIKQEMTYIREKMDNIHDKLLGNGKPGLFDEINQVKGSIKTVAFIGGVVTFVITCAMFYMNYIKK
jgi:hypothetical protein